MNSFDVWIIKWFNQFAQHSNMLDKMMYFLSDSFLLKGGLIMFIFWWLWFKEEDTFTINRKRIIFTLIGCVLSMAFARILAIASPMRLRPFHEAGLNFVVPYGVAPADMEGWSSFPSDHAALFFALSVGLYFVSKRVGIAAIIYTVLVISIPRIYIGYHYPTDLISGAIIGVLFAVVSNVYLIKWTRLVSISNWLYSKPSLFYPLFFLFSYQVAVMFYDCREVLSICFKLVRSFL